MTNLGGSNFSFSKRKAFPFDDCRLNCWACFLTAINQLQTKIDRIKWPRSFSTEKTVVSLECHPNEIVDESYQEEIESIREYQLP